MEKLESNGKVPENITRWIHSFLSARNISLAYPGSPRRVTGARYREVNSKVATAPKLKVEDKDRVINSQRIKTVKLNIVKLEALLN